MEVKEAGSSLDSLISSFNTRILELQELVIARNMYPASTITDLTAVDESLKIIEVQVQKIKDRLKEESEAIPKAKKLIDASLKQQKKLQSLSAHVPSQVSERFGAFHLDSNKWSGVHTDASKQDFKLEEAVVLPKVQEKKGRSSPPLWFITVEEIDSLQSYMRGRLTVEKINAAITDMATYAEANAHLIAAPNKKLGENDWEKALELRDIAMTETVKGKYFFLETDMKGPALKMDNTGKAILTVLRHLGRISEARIGHNRVMILLKPP